MAFTYAPTLFRLQLLAIRSRPDYVYIVGTPLSWVGLYSRLVRRTAVIIDVNEVVGARTDSASSYDLVARLDRVALTVWGRLANGFVTVTPDIARELRQFTERPIILVRNMPLRSEIPAYSPPPVSSSQPAKLRFVYVGTINRGLLLERIIRVFREVRTLGLENFEVDIYGFGPEEYVRSLQSQVTDLDMDNWITFHGPIPRSRVLPTLQTADVGLALYETELHGNDGLPNKVFDIVSSGRALFAAGGPSIEEFMRSNEIGGLCVGQSPAELLSGLLQLISAPERVEAMCERNSRIGASTINWECEFSEADGLFAVDSRESVAARAVFST